MRILCVRNDKLGDFTLTLPIYQLLKKENKNIHITVLVAGYVAPLAEAIPEIDDVLVDDGKILSLIKEIRKRKFDCSLTIFSTTRIGWILFLSGIKTRIAPATKIAQVFHNKTKRQKRSSVKMTEYEYNIDLLTQIEENIHADFVRPLISVTHQQKQQALKRSDIRTTKKIIALHPGSGGSSIGNLTIWQYIELADSIKKSGLFEPIFTFGPDETALMNSVKESSENKYTYYQSNDGIIDFCSLLANFSLFISTSTGTMHLAGAVNIPTLSFFGNHLIASSKRWEPINDRSIQRNYNLSVDIESDFELIQKDLSEFLN